MLAKISIFAVSAFLTLYVGVTSAAPTACMADLRCRCFVQAGATYDAFSKKLRLDEGQWTAYESCISRGLQAAGSTGTSAAQAKRRPTKGN